MYKVRFHLGAGEHFMHWQIKCLDGGGTHYISPESTNIILHGATLHNQPFTAKRIKDGANKTVCAWVLCNDVELSVGIEPVSYKVNYNPRKCIHWQLNGYNVDGCKFSRLISNGTNLFMENLGEYFLA